MVWLGLTLGVSLWLVLLLINQHAATKQSYAHMKTRILLPYRIRPKHQRLIKLVFISSFRREGFQQSSPLDHHRITDENGANSLCDWYRILFRCFNCNRAWR
ncbi:hypothetical protein OK016_16435 [Vibrio chagasii]|nr:hypothetical protein [Vibrio chagasii]